MTQHVILAVVKQLSLSKHWYYCLFTKHKALFIQVRHYGEIHLCLFVSANCCPNLETMFLGSNNPRSLNPGVFRHWPRLAFLTLENIMVENIVHCLEEVGSQLKGLKIQCSGFDLSDIAVLCPNLKSLIIQKEAPNPGA